MTTGTKRTISAATAIWLLIVALQAGGAIEASWALVLCPIWIPVVAWLAVVLAIGLFATGMLAFFVVATLLGIWLESRDTV